VATATPNPRKEQTVNDIDGAQARADFERARRRAAVAGLFVALTRRPAGLLPYREARRGVAVVGERYRGLGAVPVDRIVGSTDRFQDFDRAFRPRRAETAARWQRVARAHYAGTGLPPVRLRRLGGSYFVEDGHHRVSVARALGQRFVDAEVIEVEVIEVEVIEVEARGGERPRPSEGGGRLPRLLAALAAAWPRRLVPATPPILPR
jgi:hypothetical protein